MRKLLLPLILVLLLIFTLIGDCWVAGYDQRVKLTIDETKIDTANLTWFPITVFLTAAAGEEVFVENAADADFDRVAFTKADGVTQLKADCEMFDVSEEKGIYHVSLDGWEIADDAPTDFYMYYDSTAAHNTTYISKGGGVAAQDVWDDNFKAVYHMNDQQSLPAFYNTQYEAAVEPDSDGWTLGGTDYSSSDGDILTLDTSANDNFVCYYYKTPDVDFDAGVYMKTRVKASADMDDQSDGLIIQIKDGTQNEQFYMAIKDGVVTYIHESDTFDGFVLDTTTSYVTYEIYIKGTTFWIYADGVQKATNTVDSGTFTDLVQFGDPTASAGYMCKIEMDYLYYALGVAVDPALYTILDSTSNAEHGTKKGAGEPAEATGKVGQGQKGDGNDDYILFPATALSTTDYTIDVVFKADATHARLISPTNDATGAYQFPNIGTNYDTDVQQIARNAAGAYTYPLTGDASWHHTTWIRTSGTITGYEDGAIQNLTEAGSDFSQDGYDFTGTEFMALRFLYDSTYYYSPASIDEYRISSSARAAAWVKATYNSLWDTLLTYGAEEEFPGILWNGILIKKWNGITITTPLNTQ